MGQQAEGHDDIPGTPAGREALLPVAGAAALLAVALGTLGAVDFLPVDLRWCAPLASAWCNVLVVAIGVLLGDRGRRVAPPGSAAGLLAAGLRRVFPGKQEPEQSDNPWPALAAAIDWRPWAVTAGAGLSVAMAALAWQPPSLPMLIRAMAAPEPTLAAGAACVALAFLTLVTERHHAVAASRSAVSASLTRMLRVALATALAGVLAAAWFAFRHRTADWLVQAAALFNTAVAVELAVRGVLSWFAVPRGAVVPASAIAGLLSRRPAPFASIGAELRHRYGIDLRQSWGWRSFVRLLPAALGATVAAAWLLTAVVVLNPEQRAVYERFGAPVAVWQPGLHVGLPWPFGRARIVDNGAVHQVAIAGSTNEGGVDTRAVPADGPTPEGLDRLWDAAHPGETTQVIAGANGDRQNFQIVNADVRVDYRLGSTDADARAALYRTIEPESTVRASASRELVHYLASHTLESLLETNQAVMADRLKRAIQQQLDRLQSGVDVVAVVIESVHPPTGAAAAFHDVQAAQIRAQGSVAQARGFAAGLLGNARQQALVRIAQAEAQAGDTLSSARVQQIDFDADLVAYRLGGPAFPFEYYLDRLQRGLRNARMTILDDRLADGTRATVDLRNTPAGDLAGIH
ncbi:membrane protease [Burkholderia cepacia]|uniref:protease modulator HflK n=1 Tax=Burkholderia cepacia TaxID=292 RepID=UPI000757FA0B|nr:protease modulator HflK [Burkholderia cepacia]KVQ28112.1 membrane protease [Burkholderia cepacia]KVW05350.1 membrane protease [Burkholderia cepacia]KWH21788.1 membrane protease [Burkholderia cepacia]